MHRIAEIFGISLFIATFCYSPNTLGHGDKHQTHSQSLKQGQTTQTPGTAIPNHFSTINTNYLKNIKPIFEQKCFDCHSDKTRFPWYYSLPIVRQIINSDIQEAREHLDFTPDFPFKSHETPIEDLKAIIEDVEKDTMPPWNYRLMHRHSALTPQEKELVIRWAGESLKFIESKPQD